MIETWRKCLDENKIVGATLTDLSKAFNCLPHISWWRSLKPMAWTEPIFYNIIMNDIFFLLGSDLHNFADDNTVTAVAETIEDLINSLEVKTSNIIEWMKGNDMIANLKSEFKPITHFCRIKGCGGAGCPPPTTNFRKT